MRMLVIVTLAAAAACSTGRSGIDVAPAEHQSAMGQPSTTARGLASTKAGFEYRRVHSGAGQFIAADVLAASGDEPLLTVLRNRILGFPSFGPPSGSRGDQSGCLDQYVNGQRVADVIDTIHPRDLYGVEYYQASSAPVAYRRAFSTCSVLLLWLQ
jgi:hypothetical protein